MDDVLIIATVLGLACALFAGLLHKREKTSGFLLVCAMACAILWLIPANETTQSWQATCEGGLDCRDEEAGPFFLLVLALVLSITVLYGIGRYGQDLLCLVQKRWPDQTPRRTVGHHTRYLKK